MDHIDMTVDFIHYLAERSITLSEMGLEKEASILLQDATELAESIRGRKLLVVSG